MPSLRDSSHSPWAFPGTPVPGYCYAVPTGLLAFGAVTSRHSRAGLLLCRPYGTPRIRRGPFPALPCRVIDYAVPTGLLALGVGLPGTHVPGYCYAVPTGLLAFGVGLPRTPVPGY